MSEDLYSPDQVAELLGVHVRTVRNYVRGGKLKAVRIGKQYRIAGEDLAQLTGRPVAAFRAEPVRRQRHVDVSSIVEIDAISPELAGRMTNMLMGAAKGRGAGEEPLRIESIYDETRGRMKVIVVGCLEDSASFLKVIKAMLEA